MWRFTPGIDNPADIASRGSYLSTLEENAKWWQGPGWLRLPKDSWSASPEVIEPPDKDALIETKSRSDEILLLTNTENCRNLSAVFDIGKYSSCQKLFKITALVLRFIKKLKSRVNKLNEEDASLNPDQFITVEEIYHSEKLWIEEIQKDIHMNEHYNGWEKNLGLFTDADGILRCKGRFRYSSLNYDEKHPAIIPRDHRLTSLNVSDAHSKVLHGGVANTLAREILDYSRASACKESN